MKGSYSIKVKQVGDSFVATGCVNMGGQYDMKAVARVSVSAVQDLIRRAAEGWQGELGGYDFDQEIGWGFIKKLWKGAKKVAKKIARSKVLGKIAKVVRDPRFMAALSVVPGVGPMAAAGLASAGAAYGGLQAMYAKRRGKPKLARRISRASARRSKRYGLTPKRFNRAQRYGARLAMDPRMMRFMFAGPPGGWRSMMRQMPRRRMRMPRYMNPYAMQQARR